MTLQYPKGWVGDQPEVKPQREGLIRHAAGVLVQETLAQRHARKACQFLTETERRLAIHLSCEELIARNQDGGE